jgi:hypothetical protein
MEQRTPRLGDIVDDYCPRERRVTNHAIVAIVEEAVRKTRCMTCDAEHPFKDAKAPRIRKKDSTDALYQEVLANATGKPAAGQSDANGKATDAASSPVEAAGETSESGDPGSANGNGDASEVWTAHRPLIRATLPRTENTVPIPRPIPEFTMHQRQGRGGFRGGGGGWQGGHGGGGGNGFRSGGGGFGQGGGGGRQNQGGGGGRRHGGGGKKRSR